jgi:hypothetical protein
VVRPFVDRRSRREADDGFRTRDLELGKLALYQLSYVRDRAWILGAAGASLPFLS